MKDVAIIGAGLSGLTSAILLQKRGFQAILFEKKKFPFHRVCGEYISNEIANFLIDEGLDFRALNPEKIDKLHFSAPNGENIKTELKMGAFGLSRYSFDHFLFKKALEVGVTCLEETEIISTVYEGGYFTLITNDGIEITARCCIGAFGKKSILDRKMNRSFFAKKTSFVGVKMHYSADFSANEIGLHNFNGGYCGISRVEENKVNMCYMTNASALKKAGDLAQFEKNVLNKNPHIHAFLKDSRPLFDKPLVISQMYFGIKKAVEDHVLMTGDAAGAISPLTGNGMAMAVHSAVIAVTVLQSFLNGEINRNEMEGRYIGEWNQLFRQRIFIGNLFQPLLGKRLTSAISFKILKLHPGILPGLIAHTHGKKLHEKIVEKKSGNKREN